MENKIKSGGIIQNLKMLQQSAEFDNLRFTRTKHPERLPLSPTDIDKLFEYQGKFSIWGDFKKGKKPLEDGQWFVFKQVIDDCQAGGQLRLPSYSAYFLIIEHDTHVDIPTYDASTCVVKRVYHKGKWTPIEPATTLLDAYIRIFEKHGVDKELIPYIEPPKKSLIEMLNEV